MWAKDDVDSRTIFIFCVWFFSSIYSIPCIYDWKPWILRVFHLAFEWNIDQLTSELHINQNMKEKAEMFIPLFFIFKKKVFEVNLNLDFWRYWSQNIQYIWPNLFKLLRLSIKFASKINTSVITGLARKNFMNFVILL